jgi:hypothetical protein
MLRAHYNPFMPSCAKDITPNEAAPTNPVQIMPISSLDSGNNSKMATNVIAPAAKPRPNGRYSIDLVTSQNLRQNGKSIKKILKYTTYQQKDTLAPPLSAGVVM